MTAMAFINVRPIIKVDGEENSNLGEALVSLLVNKPLNGMAHAELTLSNWVPAGESGDIGYGFQDVGFGKVLEVLMHDDVIIFEGQITALEERYGSGAPQLIILLQDKLHLLTRQRHSRVFEDQSPDDIVNSIAGELGLSADVRVSTATATYHQLNESNLAFLLRILGAHDVAIRMESGNLRVRPEEEDPEPMELSALDSAKKIRLIADLNHQPVKVKVKGFNLDNGEAVNEEADTLVDPADGITAKRLLDDLSWPGEEIVPQPFPRSQAEAGAYAEAHFNRAAKRFITGDVRCVGEPGLSSGRQVELVDVSPRFAGNYRIVHCMHRFDVAHGFETHLKVNRADGQA